MITDYEDVAKPRPREEFLTFANRLLPTIEQYAVRKSKWNGQIIFDDKESDSKLWDCSIRLNPDAPLHALIHELIHSCSVSRFGAQAYIRHRWEEELTVHYLSQELALIREFKAALGVSRTDLEFASALIKEDLGYRFEFLAAQIPAVLGSEATIEQYNDFMSKLEAIRQWTPT